MDRARAAVPPATVVAEGDAMGGCAMGGSGSGSGGAPAGLLLLLGLVGLLRLRRR